MCVRVCVFFLMFASKILMLESIFAQLLGYKGGLMQLFLVGGRAR